MAKKGVKFRVIHSKMPSGPFRETLEGLPCLSGGGMELQVCPRSHWKMVIVDGSSAFFGSANFTGAGLGVKSESRRNMEVGAVTENKQMVHRLARNFDRFWIGDYCPKCAFRSDCPDPI